MGLFTLLVGRTFVPPSLESTVVIPKRRNGDGDYPR